MNNEDQEYTGWKDRGSPQIPLIDTPEKLERLKKMANEVLKEIGNPRFYTQLHTFDRFSYLPVEIIIPE